MTALRAITWIGIISALLLVAEPAAQRAYAQDQAGTAAPGVPTRVVVTVEPRHGAAVPVINRDDVKVREDREPVQVTEWKAAQGANAQLQLFILIDDSLDPSASLQFDDLRKFINSQPPTTSIAVGYVRNGTVQTGQALTRDHAAAAKALRLPTGAPSGGPYFALVDLMKNWPEGAPRREILLISDGIEPFRAGGPSNPYVDQAIEQLQQNGIVLYSIYAPAAGHFGHAFWRINWGQNYLSEVADRTGGEAYVQRLGPPVSFAPYLQDLTNKLDHQYLLTFAAKPENKAGLRSVSVSTEVPGVDLIAADRVYVHAGM